MVCQRTGVDNVFGVYLIRAWGLLGLEGSDGFFSISTGMKRISHILCPSRMLPTFLSCHVTDEDPSNTSHHLPIMCVLNTRLPQSSTHHSKKPISHSALIGGSSLVMNCINHKQYHWRVICPIYLFHPRKISPVWMNSSTPLNSQRLGPKIGNAFCGAPMYADNLALVTSS